MASLIQAIKAYCPVIQLGKRAELNDLVDFIARSTGLNEGTIRQVLIELRDATVFFNLRGQPVYLEGLGTYTPIVELDGSLKVGHRADVEIKNRLNAPGAFQGEILRRENVPSTSSGQAAKAARNSPPCGMPAIRTIRWRNFYAPPAGFSRLREVIPQVSSLRREIRWLERTMF